MINGVTTRQRIIEYLFTENEPVSTYRIADDLNLYGSSVKYICLQLLEGGLVDMYKEKTDRGCGFRFMWELSVNGREFYLVDCIKDENNELL